MASPFGSNSPFDDDFFKQPFGNQPGGSDIDRTASRVIKTAGCAIAFWYGLLFLGAIGIVALIWKFVFAN